MSARRENSGSPDRGDGNLIKIDDDNPEGAYN
jgi:hypothetical protein